MGGTKILAAVLNSKEGILARVKIPTKEGSSEQEFIQALTKVVEEVIEKSKLKKGNIKAVCLGIPGSVNPKTGRIGLAPNLGLKDFFIKDELQKNIPFPVLVENDVNLGALGIKNFGVGKKAKDLLSVFVGTGIGGALIFNNKIYRGSTFSAGEIGHINVRRNGPLCGCGNYGCFEAVASRSAIVRDIIADIQKGKESVVSKLVKSGERIKSKAISSAVKKKDDVVIKHINEACETIGITLGSVTNLLNFDMIVLGGGVIEANSKYMLPKIEEAFHKYALADSAKGVKITASKLGDDAALFGGIALAEEFLKIKV